MARNKSKAPIYNVSGGMRIVDIERFCGRIEKGDECWRFKSKSTDKYIRFGKHLAHRISYELFVGIIPKNLTIDHLCMNRHCINPEHLEPVSLEENNRRWQENAQALKRGVL